MDTLGDAILPYVGQWGPTALLSLVFLSMLRGWIVPKATMDARVADAEARAEIWRQVAETRQASLDKRDTVIPAQLEVAKTMDHLLTSIKHATTTSTGDV